MSNWYVVYTKPKQDIVAVGNLRRQGYIAYLYPDSKKQIGIAENGRKASNHFSHVISSFKSVWVQRTSHPFVVVQGVSVGLCALAANR